MKKLLSIVFVACVLTVSLPAQTPTFVSTTPSNRNVILEEYTGIHCQYCPDGHKRANALIAANPGRAWAINIHEGGYAQPGAGEPDFRTQWGTALRTQTNLTGYPAGTINRTVFTGSATALNRGEWATYAAQVLAEVSPVNIAAKATIDFATRVLTVNVEVYYTGNSATATNFINVALVQDKILGPQTGAPTYYPEQMVGGLYTHNHMLRHLITGQWGDQINTTTQGSFVAKQYTYTIPAHLNNVEYVLDNLEIIAFITECHQFISTGTMADVTWQNGNPYIAQVTEIPSYSCDNMQFYASLKNIGSANITSVDLQYSYGGQIDTLSWSRRTIATSQTDTIALPKIPITPNVNFPVTITIIGINGTPLNGIPKAATFKKAVYNAHRNPVLKLYTDAFASETKVYLYNSSGQLLLTQGPWTNLTAVGTTERIIPLPMINADCYKLLITDDFGDGINSDYGAGHVDVFDSLGALIVTNNGQFGSQLELFFNCDALAPSGSIGAPAVHVTPTAPATYSKNKYADNNVENGVCTDYSLKYDNAKGTNLCAVGIEDIAVEDIAIYPNPVTDVLTVQSTVPVQKVEIFNLMGQLLQVETMTNSVGVSQLAAGIYAIKITTAEGTVIQKFVKQ